MTSKKTKYYVVWKGRKKGIFESWSECEQQVKGFEGAQYKSFESKQAAENAFKQNYYQAITTKTTEQKIDSSGEKPVPDINSISVDAACSGNPGVMEYRGVWTQSGKEIFRMGPFQQGTNNIGEFLAIVHGLALLQQNNSNLVIYSDSVTAQGWIKKKKCNSKLEQTNANAELFDLIERAENWLNTHTYTNKIFKWQTEIWGEIPADFGRK